MSTVKGLKKLAETYNLGNGWKYGGGNLLRVYPEHEHNLHYDLEETSHSIYFRTLCREIFPWTPEEFWETTAYPQKNKCVCGHFIKENCFIYKKLLNGNFIFKVVGNSCIKKLQLDGKRCSICNEKHKNRKDNYCNTCRKEWLCPHCGDKKGSKHYKMCRKCNFSTRNNRVRNFTGIS
tara:strand:- start:272 stop:805 length:534 start_codon:yes stop_codon:yes gene_type:complete